MSKLNSSRRSFNFPRQVSFAQPVINPFIHTLCLTPAQKLQVAFMSVTVAPFRLVMIAATLFVTWCFGRIFTIGMPVEMKEPAGPIRAALCGSLRRLGRIVIFFMGFHYVEVKGKRAPVTEAPILVAAPHSTLFDAFVSFVTEPIPSAVSRIENYSALFIGTLIKSVQPVFVSRKSSDSRKKTINEIKRRIGMPGKWPQIIMFPEGTCTNRQALITFKAGAFIPGAPVQPILVEYLNDIDSFTWTMNGPGSFSVLWLTLCQFWIKARITYLPVYKPSEMEKENPHLYANNVRLVMAEALGVPCTDHTFEDCRLMCHADSLNLPMEAGLVEFTKLSRKLGMNIDSIREKLNEFSKIARDRSDGMVAIEDFAKFLNVPITPALQNLFQLYDRDESGLIDFREYVIGLSLVSQPLVTEKSVRLAFEVFDKDQNGMITVDEFEHVLRAAFGQEMNGKDIFQIISKSNPNRVSYDEFYSFVLQRPEYAKLFMWYKDLEAESHENKEVDSPQKNEDTVLAFRGNVAKDKATSSETF